MVNAVLALLAVAATAATAPLPLVSQYGPIPREIEVEWIAQGDAPLETRTLELPDKNAGVPPLTGAESARVVGPNVVSLPARFADGHAIHLIPAGHIRLIGLPTSAVAAIVWGDLTGGARVLKTDESGIVHWLGVTSGSFVARASCEGYRAAATEKAPVSMSGEMSTLELDRAGAVRLRVKDGEGNSLPGALVFLQNSSFGNAPYPFQLPVESLGGTDFDGEISLPQRATPGFYVVAQSHALYVGKVGGCSEPGGCLHTIRLSRPSAFGGLTVKTNVGDALSAAWLVFSKDGVPIPVAVQAHLLRLNQVSAADLIAGGGSETAHMLPALLGPGTYDVEYTRQRPGGTPDRIPLGRLTLDSSVCPWLPMPDMGHAPYQQRGNSAIAHGTSPRARVPGEPESAWP